MIDFALLSPLGLLALGALVLPVAIHLLSRSRGKTIPVGWIQLYRPRDRRRVSELRVRQWPLLLVRMLVLAVAAMVLAGLATPQIERLVGSTAYVTSDWWQVYSGSDVKLAGYDHVFLLAEGYPSITQTPATISNLRITADQTVALLAERLDHVDHVGEVSVFALDRAVQFPEHLPRFGQGLQWHLAPPKSLPAGSAPDKTSGLLSPRTTQLQLAVTIVHTPERRHEADLIEQALGLISLNRPLVVQVQARTHSSETTAASLQLNSAAVLRKAEPLSSQVTSSEVEASRSAPQESEQPLQVAILLDAPLTTAPSGTALILTDADAESLKPELVGLSSVLHLMEGPKATARINDGGAVGVDGYTSYWLSGFIKHAESMVRVLIYTDAFKGVAGSPMLEAGFPEALLRLMLIDRTEALQFTHAEINPVDVLRTAGDAADPPLQSLSSWLALLLALLVGIERWMSERKIDAEAVSHG